MVREPAHVPADGQQSIEQIPPLEPGDRLTRVEFERRYEVMPGGIKAKLLEGVVHMPSPTRFCRHGRPHLHLTTWLGYYESGTPGVEAGDNSRMRLDSQPDAVLLIDPAYGGQAHISADDSIEDAPEFVAEVTASSVSIDLHTKFSIYQRSGVREYLVWRCSNGPSIGSSYAAGTTNGWCRIRMGCCAARSSLVCGWIRQRCCGVTSRLCSRPSSKGW
jgi:hypothetical protein